MFQLNRFDRWILRKRWISGAGSALAISLAGVYWTMLDVRSDWPCFTEYPRFHDWLSAIFAGIAIGMALLNWLKGRAIAKQPDTLDLVFGEFVKMTGRIVKAKIDRTSRLMPELKGSKVYSKVCDPNSQIDIIYAQAATFFQRVLSIDAEDIDFTIMEKLPGGSWQYATELCFMKGVIRMPIAELLKEGSTAALVLKQGGHVFFPSKLIAGKLGRYRFDGTRDAATQDGSIFTMFFDFTIPAGRHEYLFNIVTFKRRMCDPGPSGKETDDTKSVEGLCREIARRVELELCSRVIKKVP